MPDEQTPHQKLVAEYELDVPQAVQTEPPSAQPRDDKGRFLPPESTSAEVSTPPPSPTPQHDPYFVRLAEDLGIPTADVKSYSPDELKVAIRHEQRSVLAERERSRREVPRETPHAPEPAPTPAEPQFDLDLGEDQYDPKIAGLAKALKHALAKIEALEGKVGTVEGYVQGQAQLTARQQADRFFAKNESRYGKGSREELPDDSPLVHKRVAILDLAAKLAKPNESHAAAMARAEQVIYGDQPAETKPAPAAPRPSDREQEWADAAVARPTQRVPADEPKGKRRAARVIGEMLTAQNSANGSEHSELPD